PASTHLTEPTASAAPSASPSPSSTTTPETAVPESGAPAATGGPSGGVGSGGTADSGSGGSGGRVAVAGLDDGSVVRTVTLGALAFVGLFLVGFQLFGRRNRGR